MIKCKKSEPQVNEQNLLEKCHISIEERRVE